MSEKPQYLIVNADVLPDVFTKVIEAKQLLSKAQAKNSSDACRIVGISRSAYYKYKDNVQVYEEKGDGQLGTLILNCRTSRACCHVCCRNFMNWARIF